MALPEQLRNSIVFLFCSLCSGCVDNPQFVESNDTALVKSKGKYFYLDDLYSGFIFELFDNGDTNYIMSIQKGEKNGLSKYFWSNGNIKTLANYQNNLFHGEIIEYYENGQMYSKFNYKNGHESGLQQVWKSDGRIKVNYEMIDGRKYGLTGVKNCVNVLEDSTGHF